MKALEKIFKCHDASLPTKIKSVEVIAFPMTLYGSEDWTLKKQDKMLLKFGIGENLV